MSVFTALFLMLLVVIGGCADTGEEIPPEVRAEREISYRRACIARELVARAEDDVEVLAETLGNVDPADPLAAVTRSASEAALEFARAYGRHAELRASAYDLVNSAVNQSETSADSARLIEQAQNFSITIPAEGTVEANVLASYQTNLNTMLADEDHPCNWDIPF